jgi:hypothetical protein
MVLKPVIASYSGESYARIKQCLDDPILDVIAQVARAPQPSAEIPREVAAELVEMHVFVVQDGLVRLNTAVFLKSDIKNILSTVSPLAKEFAQRILECGAAFRHAPAEVTSFLAGILGVVQGIGRHMSQKIIGSAEWKEYAGKYARSKVDFDELCDIYETIGPDYLNKTVLPGERYTAVFIGPGGINFQSLNFAVDSPELSKIYAGNLNRYLVDAYAELVAGKIQNEALYAAAEAAHLYQQDKLRSDEFFFVLEGQLLIDLEGKTIEVNPNQGVTITKGVMHRTRAPHKTVMLMVETSEIQPTSLVGDHLGMTQLAECMLAYCEKL